MLIIGGCKTGGGSSSGGGGGGGADLSIPAAGPEDYTAEDYESLFKMWEAFSIAYTDADKTGSDDSNLCWAATAANLLTWSGWAADEDDVFNTFNAHFANQPGYMYLEEDDNFVLMFTDSDDYLDQMRNFKTVWNDDTDRWEIQGVYGGWYLEYVVSLDID